MHSSRMVALGSLAGSLLVAGCGHRSHMDEAAWTWRGDVGTGAWVHVRNTNGAIRIDRASGSQVEAAATRQWRGRRPEEVRFAAVRTGRDVTLCALWGSNSECDPSQQRHSDHRSWWRRLFFPRSRVSVDFVVRIPQGVKVDASSVNGPIGIEGATADIIAETVNGPIRAHTARGALRAETVNGPITAAVDSLAAGGDISLHTVNGPVTAELPDSVNAEVVLSTVNGRIVTDYPLTVSGGMGRFGPKEMTAVIGHGGRRISLETINGNATLKKRT